MSKSCLLVVGHKTACGQRVTKAKTKCVYYCVHAVTSHRLVGKGHQSPLYTQQIRHTKHEAAKNRAGIRRYIPAAPIQLPKLVTINRGFIQQMPVLYIRHCTINPRNPPTDGNSLPHHHLGDRRDPRSLHRHRSYLAPTSPPHQRPHFFFVGDATTVLQLILASSNSHCVHYR